MENIRFLTEILSFSVVKFSIYLNRRVFVMKQEIHVHFIHVSTHLSLAAYFTVHVYKNKPGQFCSSLSSEQSSSPSHL